MADDSGALIRINEWKITGTQPIAFSDVLSTLAVNKFFCVCGDLAYSN